MTWIRNSIDFIFKHMLLFLFCAIWTNFYIKDLILSLSLALILTMLISLLFHKRSQTQALKLNQTVKEAKAINNLILHLCMQTEDQALAFFAAILQKKKNLVLKDGFLIIDENIAFFSHFKRTPLQEDALFCILRKCKEHNLNKLVLVAPAIADASKQFLAGYTAMQTEVIDQTALSAFLARHDATELNIPQVPQNKTKKVVFKQLLFMIFNRKQSKSFFFMGIIMLFSSLITPFTLYYNIFASAMFACSLFCLFNTPFSKRKPDEHLL